MPKESQEPSFSSVTSHTSFVSHQTDSNCTGADAENIMRSNRIEKTSIVKITRKRKKKPKKKPEVLNRPHKISLSTPNVSDVCLASIYKIHNHRQYKKKFEITSKFYFSRQDSEYGWWYIRMVGKANLPLRRTRPFTQLVTVPNLLQPDKLVSYPIQKKYQIWNRILKNNHSKAYRNYNPTRKR